MKSWKNLICSDFFLHTVFNLNTEYIGLCTLLKLFFYCPTCRQQMLEHFAECMKMSKGQRLEAIQVNVYTALLLALRTLAETKSMLGQDPVKNIATELVIVRFYYYFYLFKRVVKAFIITLEF